MEALRRGIQVVFLQEVSVQLFLCADRVERVWGSSVRHKGLVSDGDGFLAALAGEAGGVEALVHGR